MIMIIEGILSSLRVIERGLYVSFIWLFGTGCVYGILLLISREEPKALKTSSAKDSLITGGFLAFWTIALFAGWLVAIMIVTSSSSDIQYTKFYTISYIALLVLTVMAFVASCIWLILLIQRKGIWPATKVERVKQIISGGTSFLLLITLLRALSFHWVTLLRALYFWFR